MADRLHNRSILKESRKALRNDATPAEQKLWGLLKHNNLQGRKFRRQHSVGNYILDFYCPAERLAIELDGAQHYTEEGKKYDQDRTIYLEDRYIRVLRFPNHLVLENSDAVLAAIVAAFN